MPLTYFAVEWVWWMDLFSHMAWHALWASVLVCVACGVMRFWHTAAFGVCVVGACALWSWQGPVAPALAQQAPGQTLCVANVLTSNQDHARARAWLTQRAPSGAFFVEVDARWERALSAMSPQLEHVRGFPRQDNFGVASLTRAQPASAKLVTVGGWHALEVLLPTEQLGQLRVLVVHPLPPIGADYTRRRNAHMQALGAFIAASNQPTVVLGALNMTPWSPHFRSFVRAARLARAKPAWRRAATWPTGFPDILRIPIDHVLVSERLAARAVEVGPDIGSDHLPVCVEIGLR